MMKPVRISARTVDSGSVFVRSWMVWMIEADPQRLDWGREERVKQAQARCDDCAEINTVEVEEPIALSTRTKMLPPLALRASRCRGTLPAVDP